MQTNADVCTPHQTSLPSPSIHSPPSHLKPLSSRNLLHSAPPPSLPPVKSFHIHTLSPLRSCRRSVVHPPLLTPILPSPSPILLCHPPLSTSLYGFFRSATACRVHCGRRSQNDSRHSSLPPFPPLPRHPSFLQATFSLPPLYPYTRSVP